MSETDTDGDGTPDCIDGCPDNPDKTAPGICGCALPDTDTDADGTPDCFDGCPNDPNKTAPGVCLCGTPDVDTDNDGTLDCQDGCPNDPTKIMEGICGCGQPDVDTDGDGALDCNDECPNDPNKIVMGSCPCGVADVDTDNDGTLDCHDVCPFSMPPEALALNEIYANHLSPSSGPMVHKDTAEFIEITGPPGGSLDCYMVLVVDGDGVNAGILDRAFDLAGQTIPASGYFVLGDSAVPQKNYDMGEHDRLENGTCTIYLVNVNGPISPVSLVGTRVDTGPGTTAIPTLGLVIDKVGIADAGYPSLDAVFDGAPVFGPDATFMPAGIYRCGNAPNGWAAQYSDYDPASVGPLRATPGAANPGCDPGVGFCSGDGSAAPCPCDNQSAAGSGAGCLHSGGNGGLLTAGGSSSLAHDSVVLYGTQMLNSSALYFQGTIQVNGGEGAAFGDGLRCAGGTVNRLGVKPNSGGASQYPVGNDAKISVKGAIASPGTRTYQVWFRNAAPYCNPETFNLTNGLSIVWVP
jgi:hypothetical protein